MKGLLATLILGFVITGTSAQYCGECYQPILDFYDWIAVTFSWGAPFGEYADYLRYIKSIREQNNCRGTAYAMDYSVTPGPLGSFEWNFQKNVAYATSLVNPADTDCNPFFLDKYSQYGSYAFFSWQCKSRCEAADVIAKLNFIVPTTPGAQDRLGSGCFIDDYLRTSPWVSCAPESISRNEMLLAFYNSNNQNCGSGNCNAFPTRISTKIGFNAVPSSVCGFEGRNLNWSHYWPSVWMKFFLNNLCCDGATARSSPMESDRARARRTTGVSTNGEEMKDLNAKTEAEFAKQFPESGGSSTDNDDGEIPDELTDYTREQTQGMKRAIAAARQNGFNLGGANPLEDNDSEPAKPARPSRFSGK